jgi:Predicted transcriptional regulators
MNASRLKAAIGANVKTLREKRGLSQEQLAEAIDRTWQAVSHIETGKTLPPLTTLWAIATALRVPLNDLLCETGLPATDRRADLLRQAQAVMAGFSDDRLDMAVKVLGVLREGDRRAS